MHNYASQSHFQNGHKRTLADSRIRTETGQTQKGVIRRLGKSHVDYWHSKLKKRSYTDRKGAVVEVPNWQVRMQKSGREGWFNLGTPNQAAAAKKAKEIFTFLDANGWDATLAKFKPGPSGSSANGTVTVGEFLRGVETSGLLRTRTFLNYQNCLRTIVAGIFGVKEGVAKFDYRSGGNAKWAERIDRVRLERISPDKVMRWQQRFLGRAGKSPVARGSAMRTANSYVRCARSLFSTKIRKAIKGLDIAGTAPFEGVELFEAGSMKYVSKVNAAALIAAAKSELKASQPQVYKAFLLGLFGGMRKGEIDLVEWRMLDWENNVIKLEQTEWLHLKTEDSAGVITLDAELMAELRELKKMGTGTFVIESDRQPRNDSARPYYRCEAVFDELNVWLRNKGITANKPLHELRKEIGALIATQHGIYAASRFLRHSDITTTARHYAHHKDRISVGLGKILDASIRPVSDTEALSAPAKEQRA